jgi:hypothetical protein
VPEPIPPAAPNDQTALILARLNRLEATLAPTVTVRWRIGPVTPQQQLPSGTQTSAQPRAEGTSPMADLILTADQQARLAATGQDADGNPVDLTGGITYGVSDPAILTLTDNGDGTALVVTTGPTGSALVTATGTVAGGGQVIGSLAVDVVAGDVASIQISATAEPQGTP